MWLVWYVAGMSGAGDKKCSESRGLLMKSTRRQFLVQSVKAGLAVVAGVLGGVALARKPTYEVLADPADEVFTTEGWVRAKGFEDDHSCKVWTRNKVQKTWRVRTVDDEWVHVPLGNLHTDVFYPIGWEDINVPNA